MKKDLIDYEIKLGISGYLTEADIVEELRLLADSMSTHKALAEKIGISEAYLCDILNRRRSPGESVCRFLKVKPVTIYMSTDGKTE